MVESPDNNNEPPANLVGAGVVLLTLLGHGLGWLLIWFAVLREDHAFWTHAGGYPILLRDVVLWTFLPLFGGTVFLLGVLSLLCVSKIGGGLRLFAVESVLVLIGWGLVGTSGYIAFQNNLVNLLNGKAVHRHETE